MRVGKVNIAWVGAKSAAGVDHDAVLYSAANCEIRHVKSHLTGLKRTLIDDSFITPKHSEFIDIIVGYDPVSGTTLVTDIIDGGGSNYLQGNYALQVSKSNRLAGARIGDQVSQLILDEIDFRHISSAVSIGPSVHHFLYHDDHNVNHDLSLGSKPPFVDRRMARSVIYKTNDGKTHIRVFDGAPKTKNFQGLSPLEVAMLIPPDSVEWSYHLDPGQSSKLAVRSIGGQGIETYGNMHYLRWPSNASQAFLWNGPNGRSVASAITLGIK